MSFTKSSRTIAAEKIIIQTAYKPTGKAVLTGAAPRFRSWGTKSVASEASEKIFGLSPQEQQFGGTKFIIVSIFGCSYK
jgi:hypothetical protein